VRKIAAIAGTGLHYTNDHFDRERYEELRDLAAAMIAAGSDISPDILPGLLADGVGYQTPRLDVRGAIFRGDQILMVREAADGKWSIPGGFIDVGLSASQAVEKEIREESGLIARAVKLVGYLDRDRIDGVPPYLFHIHKVYFLCEELGGDLTPSPETLDVAFHPLDHLPELSIGRIAARQIAQIAERRTGTLPPFFD
jgi:ADP-ribose pyrophosphatase YjhB (NUDIX family)